MMKRDYSINLRSLIWNAHWLRDSWIQDDCRFLKSNDSLSRLWLTDWEVMQRAYKRVQSYFEFNLQSNKKGIIM